MSTETSPVGGPHRARGPQLPDFPWDSLAAATARAKA